MGFLFFIAVIAVIIYLSSNANNANRQKWQTAAQRLNLGFYKGGMGSIGRIAGPLHGHQASISTFTRGSGSASQTYTKYQLEYREPVDVVFKVNTQHMKHRVEKLFGLQDIEVGDPEFDKQLLLQGNDPDEIRHFLTPRLREEIRLLAATYPDITVTNSLVVVNKRGADTDPAIMVHTARRIAGFCDMMAEAATGAETYLELDGELQNVESQTEDPVIEPDEPSFNPLYPPNPVVPEPVWSAGGEEGSSVDLEVSSEDEESAEEPAAEIRNKSAAPPVTDEASVRPAEAAEEQAPAESTVSELINLEAAARELFGDSGSSLLTSKVFEEQFKGRSVSGAGELTHVGKFSYDPIFTNIKGVKATISVCTLPGTYSKIKVVAEVVYPWEQYESLHERVDTNLSVSGKLIGQDATMHRFYVDAMQ